MKTKKKPVKVSLKEYAEKYNPVLNRRGNRMSYAYLYRLIRQDCGTDKVNNTIRPSTRALWFKYELEGPQDRVWIILD